MMVIFFACALYCRVIEESVAKDFLVQFIFNWKNA